MSEEKDDKEEKNVSSEMKKAVKVGAKISSIFEPLPSIIKKPLKVAGYVGSIERYNKCRERGSNMPVCIIAEGSNIATRTAVQAMGVTYISAGAVAMGTPTGVTQVMGAMGASAGIKAIYDADKIGDEVGLSVERIGNKVSKKVDDFMKRDKKKTFLDEEPKEKKAYNLYINEDMYYRISPSIRTRESATDYLNGRILPFISRSKDRSNFMDESLNTMTELSKDVKSKTNKHEKFKMYPTTTPDMFKKYNDKFFDGSNKNGYMNGVSQPTTNIEPVIEVFSRQPDVSMSSSGGFNFMVMIPILTFSL
jgi:hypothetical protein